MKLNREKMRQNGDYHKAGDQPFVNDFATRLSALVRNAAFATPPNSSTRTERASERAMAKTQSALHKIIKNDV